MDIKKRGQKVLIDCRSSFCNTKRKKPFTIEVFTFNYKESEEDRKIIDSLLKDANDLARDVMPYAANDSVHPRSHDRILANSIAGVLSEYCWKDLLNYKSPVVRSTPFEAASTQIDLEIICNSKKIEVRSSFPRNGIEFAICHPDKEFDILGPYNNDYKAGEVQKDYYVRCLFCLAHPTDIISAIKTPDFPVYLTGGSTWEMMNDPSIYTTKNLIPEDSLSSITDKSNYRVVPFHSALDTAEIYKLIVNER